MRGRRGRAGRACTPARWQVFTGHNSNIPALFARGLLPTGAAFVGGGAAGVVYFHQHQLSLNGLNPKNNAVPRHVNLEAVPQSVRQSQLTMVSGIPLFFAIAMLTSGYVFI